MKKIISSQALTLLIGLNIISKISGFISLQVTGRYVCTDAKEKTSNSNRSRVLRMSEQEDVEKLLAQAARLREESNRLAEELGKEVESKSNGKIVSPSTGPLTIAEAVDLLSPIDIDSSSATEQSEFLSNIPVFSRWNSVSGPRLRTFAVSQDFLKMRTSEKVTGDSLGVFGDPDVSLDDLKNVTAIVVAVSSILAVAALVFLPENLGATFTYVFGGIPIAFVALGSTQPGIIADVIGKTKKTRDDDVQKSERVCVHEAGHFLCGYICGLPVKSYTISDETMNYPCVEFHATGGGTLEREYTNEEIAALSVVAMSGSVAEVIKFDQAKGGGNDLVALDGFFRRSKEFIGAAKQEDLTRWGALLSYQILTENKDTFAKLIDAFKRKDSIKECIAIIESRP